MKEYSRLFSAFSLLLLPIYALAGQPLRVRTLSQDGYLAKFDYSNAKRPGIVIEMIHALEAIDPGLRIVGLEVAGSTARIEEELASGNIDVSFGLAKTPEREARGFVFSSPPLYVTHQKLVVRKDDPIKISNLDDVRKLGASGKILTFTASAQANWLKRQGGLIVDDGSKSTKDNLEKLLSGRGRFFYGSDIGLATDIRELKIQQAVRVLPPDFDYMPVYAMWSKQAPKTMTDRVQKDLVKLQESGKLEQIYRKYAP